MFSVAGAPLAGIKCSHVAPPWLFFRSRTVLRSFTVSASSPVTESIRVRFAPSPTGNLHVGGARTALFNYLFARSKGGKFVLRIEDTDLERSTKESEDSLLRDLSWLGLDWDEGPGVGGNYGPYRQSERNSLYKHYADQLLQSGHVYRCFCTNEELESMKEIAKLKQLPPVYTGKWASATDVEVQEELGKGTPYTYRFRVPKHGSLIVDDLIRGEVSWNFDTLGDFVIMRSNGQPVYNFCVTVDDATMAISHVIRAEEHLPNTLRQGLIYKALGFRMPQFAHVSLILAPDKSKLSKRHGATSVGQFAEMGFLPQAMVNYLALLGWGDGTENEFFTLDQLVDKFTIERVNKSGAVFDSTKLSPEAKPVLEDGLSEIASSLLAAYDSGELKSALEEGHAGWQTWVKSFGKSLKRKGKALFMPLRVLLTGKLHGPDMGASMVLLYKAGCCGVVVPQSGFVSLDDRFKMLREVEWESLKRDNPVMESTVAVPS
ncbi:glutamate--tRNA ligase, chloroplastic/mitochondrial isoform X2 [Primulina eburnea]|uniref:glutamate--tRNA ligase, chloroplastic/mitochondrial isoform X2 n=1 Tax=Primulina eburnea TaxID=1245227 RepID=UPI003C6BE427